MIFTRKIKKVIAIIVIVLFVCVSLQLEDAAFAGTKDGKASDSAYNVSEMTSDAAEKASAKIGKKKTGKKKAAKKKTKKKSAKKKAKKKKLLKNFKSYKRLKKHIKKVKKAEIKRRKQMLKKLKKKRRPVVVPENSDAVPDDSMVKEAAPISKAAPGKSASDHTGTYTQVKGVAEADMIKTDGKYIYYVDYSCVRIARAIKGKVKLLSKIKPSSTGYISEIYLKGDKLIVIGENYLDSENTSDDWYHDYYDTFSTATVYNIKNRKKPDKIGYYSQNGDLISSRMIGSHVYLVSDEYISSDLSHYVPCIKKKGTVKRIKPGNIYTFPGAKSTNYAVVGSLDVNSGKKMTSRTKAVLGASDDIYCSLTNLYIASSSCGHYFDVYDWEDVDEFGFNGKTQIMRAALNNGSISFKAVGNVRGMINNQFSMDENGDYFRIATTASAKDGEDINYLYILNKNLKKVGRTRGFAKGEHIEAVRFIGDKGYVITYEETDPLFVIDLSKAKSPKIEGSVEITGFSTLLHPVGKTKLLGIGYATEDLGEGMQFQSGIKLALYDIKSSALPKVMDSKSFTDIYSDVQDDHRAFLVNKKRKYYGVPYYNYDYENGETGGVLCFKIDGSKITIKKQWKCKYPITRCIAIGPYVYALSDEGKLLSFRL